MMIDSLLAGGAERVAVELAIGLDRERFLPHVLVTRGSGPLRRLLDEAGVPYTILDRARRFDYGAWRAARKLVAQADIIHSHKFGSNVWGALLSRRTGVPLIAHEHNFAAESSTFRALVDRHIIAPAASRIVCVADSVRDVELSMGIAEHKLVTVPNGAHLEAALDRDDARAELGLELDADTFIVGIVGRLRPEKAHDVALTAMAHLARAGVDAQLCIVGDGPCESDLRALARNRGVNDRIIWAGERRDAARLAGAFDAALVCSRWEGMPLAALEAMAAGVPLIATRVGALPSLVAQGRGIAVDVADDRAIAAAIADLASDEPRRQALGGAGREHVRNEYSFDRMVRRVEALYIAVLAAEAEAAVSQNFDSYHFDEREEAA